MHVQAVLHMLPLVYSGVYIIIVSCFYFLDSFYFFMSFLYAYICSFSKTNKINLIFMSHNPIPKGYNGYQG